MIRAFHQQPRYVTKRRAKDRDATRERAATCAGARVRARLDDRTRAEARRAKRAEPYTFKGPARATIARGGGWRGAGGVAANQFYTAGCTDKTTVFEYIKSKVHPRNLEPAISMHPLWCPGRSHVPPRSLPRFPSRNQIARMNVEPLGAPSNSWIVRCSPRFPEGMLNR